MKQVREQFDSEGYTLLRQDQHHIPLPEHIINVKKSKISPK